MRILILGGTQFVGRHIVEALLLAGHNVSILNRGITPDELPDEVKRIRGDRDKGVQGIVSLKDRSWDACVDVSGYTPRRVRPSAELLHARVKRYLFISAVSVYGDSDRSPVYETHPLLPPAGEDVTEITSSETYGALKVTCENIVQEIYGERSTILRPQIVAGPYDPYDRYSYWVRRATQGGEMLAPGDGSDYLQVIDARDLARFVINVIENDLGGVFNISGPRLTWASFMKMLNAQIIVWAPANVIKSEGLTEFELPLFRPERGPRSSLMDVSNELALKAGLKLTDPEVTIRHMKEWIPKCDLDPAFAPEREAELIRTTQMRNRTVL